MVLFGCVAEQAPAVDLPTRQGRDGSVLASHLNGDGTYSYDVVEDFDASETWENGAITWEYAGQAKFAVNSAASGPIEVYADSGEGRVAADRVWDGGLLDREGRLWSVADLDIGYWLRVLSEEGGASERGGEVSDPFGASASSDWDGVADGLHVGTLTLASWGVGCTNIGGFANLSQDNRWDGESRIELTSPLPQRGKAAVTIFTDGIATCSGVLLDSTHVLTAAHCLRVCNNGTWASDDVELGFCTQGNRFSDSSCSLLEDVYLPQEFLDDEECDDWSTSEFGNDWALVRLADALSPFAEFDTSTLSSLAGRELKAVGSPGRIPQASSGTCADNTTSPEDDQMSEGVRIYVENSINVTDFIGAVGKAKMDLMPGQSGSPLYHCYDDANCTTNNKGVVDIVMTGFIESSGGDRVSGPRVPAFRSELLANYPL